MIPLHTALTPADIHHLHSLYGGEVVREPNGFRLVGATIAGVVQDFYAATPTLAERARAVIGGGL